MIYAIPCCYLSSSYILSRIVHTRTYRSDNASSGCLQEVKNTGESLTSAPKSGHCRLQELRWSFTKGAQLEGLDWESFSILEERWSLMGGGHKWSSIIIIIFKKIIFFKNYNNNTLLKSYKKLHTKLQKNIHKKEMSRSIQNSGKTASQFRIPRNHREL